MEENFKALAIRDELSKANTTNSVSMTDVRKMLKVWRGRVNIYKKSHTTNEERFLIIEMLNILDDVSSIFTSLKAKD